jgi:hypothetical protein
MNDMIERVAQAMYEDNYEDGWAAALPEQRWYYIGLATIAIEAMHEPTEEMRRAARDTETFVESDIWRAMIDAALPPAVAK